MSKTAVFGMTDFDTFSKKRKTPPTICRKRVVSAYFFFSPVSREVKK